MGGTINLNNKDYKPTLSRVKNGYTLIEMIVVLAIAATLIALGAGGLISLRAQYTLDAAAEELVS